MEQITLNKINREEAFRYMAAEGYKPEGVMAELADDCEEKLLAVITPKYTYKVFKISSNRDNKVTLENSGLVFEGKDISKQLEGCHSAVVMCATLGAGVDALIRRLQVSDMTRAVITDSYASAAAEQVCNEFDEILRKKYPDKFITWRFSAGYGDFPLDIQGKLLEALNAMRLTGICLSSAKMLVPVKSVTAVCGISDNELPRRRRGCAGCTLKGQCMYRKRGTRCEF